MDHIQVEQIQAVQVEQIQAVQVEHMKAEDRPAEQFHRSFAVVTVDIILNNGKSQDQCG